MQVNDAVGDTALVEQLQLHAGIAGRARWPPPTTMGERNRWISSTNPAPIAWAASSAPPTLRSRSAAAFICRTVSGSKACSSLVLGLDTASSVLEYTTLSAACHIPA
jgi:hypothetical protein